MPRPRTIAASTRANRNETNDNDTNQDEANTDAGQENQQNPIFIEGDENEEQRMVTLEEFNDMMTGLTTIKSDLLKKSSAVKPRMGKSPFCAARLWKLRMSDSSLL
ncbi:uncharacterized protein EURHEDRAFT_412480, partial [Aspergillus ruber CBS 135680]